MPLFIKISTFSCTKNEKVPYIRQIKNQRSMSKMLIHKSALLLIAAAFGFFACTKMNKSSRFIDPPFNGISETVSSYTVDAVKGDTLKFGDGSSIVVPPSAFVDETDNPVKGKVKLNYREFHSAAQVISSGIPMTYDTAGESLAFETAGMFEISATHKKEQVRLAKGKSIQVNMISYQSARDYNFYYLDTVKKQWVYKGITSPKENQIARNILDELPPDTALLIKPVMPVKAKKEDILLDFDIRYSAHPELIRYNGLIWIFAGGENDGNPQKNTYIYKTTWDDMTLTRYNSDTNLYFLTLSNASRTFRTIVKPALAGKSFDKAISRYNEEMKKYYAYLESQKAAARMAKLANSVTRSFDISGFGIYNWDRIYKRPYIQVRVHFDIKGKGDPTTYSYYYISSNGGVTVRFNYYDNTQITINPGEKNTILAIMPDNKIAVFDHLKFVDAGLADKAPEFIPTDLTYDLSFRDPISIKGQDDLNQILNNL